MTNETAAPSRRRGVLAMLDGSLPCYPYSETILKESTAALRKRHSKRPRISASSTPQELPRDAEWTLLFLADSHNLNSIRFRPILVDFVQQSHSECCCICLPNHDYDQDLLCAGTGFFSLSWTYPNRAAILQLLSASEVPSVIVVENATGRLLTDKGMQAIESNDVHELLKRWRRRETGLSWGQSIQSSCCIS